MLAACSSDKPLPAVTVATPTADPNGCAQMSGRLPERLSTLTRRPTTPEDRRLAAYGEPPVVIRCGAPKPPEYQRATPLVNVNDVPWMQQEQADSVKWTTPTLFVIVEVVVPKKYEGHGEFLAEIAPAVRAAQ